MKQLLKLSGHQNIVRLQGSSSLALEIAILNFVKGRVLLIDTGYYSERLKHILKNNRMVNELINLPLNEINNFDGNFDWVIACYVETSVGLKIPSDILYNYKNKFNSKLLLDATASIGLESEHEMADVIAYSSCKGLCGLTGASFIAYNDLKLNEVESFYLNIDTHLNKSVTGPYHVIQSLLKILEKYDSKIYAVKKNKRQFVKRFSNYMIYPEHMQPNLCSNINKKIKCNNGILYEPRALVDGSIVCHLGEVHLGFEAKGQIVNKIQILD